MKGSFMRDLLIHIPTIKGHPWTKDFLVPVILLFLNQSINLNKITVLNLNTWTDRPKQTVLTASDQGLH